MKKQEKKFVLAALALLAITGLLALAGCKNDTVPPEVEKQEQGDGGGSETDKNDTVPEPTRYTVKFDKNAEDASGEMQSQIFTEGVEQELSANEFKRDTYTFNGWSEDKAATAPTYKDKAKFKATKDTTLYAVWTDNGTVSPVTFSLPDGTKFYFGESIAVSLTSEEGATIQYKLGDQNWQDYTADTTIPITGDTTITAKATKEGLKPSETSATYTVRKLEGITVTTLPAQTVYSVGQSFDPTGMEVTATYDDGTTRTVTGTITTDTSTLTESAGVQTVTVRYSEGGIEVSGQFEIRVLPKKLTNYTSPNHTGSEWTYVEFGEWPQNEAPGVSPTLVDPQPENLFKGKYYSDANGEYVKEDGKYYKVEPIVWRVLNKDYASTGKALLLAEKILTGGIKWADSSNNYMQSYIRQWLNGNSGTGETSDYNGAAGFLQTAFTADAQDLIAPTTVDNSAASTTDAGNNLTLADGCSDTTDKIFLLSEKEATTGEYGFAEYNVYVGDGTTLTSTRIRVTTDYAQATGADQSSTEGYGGWWWLRSPYYRNVNIARVINLNGDADYYSSVDLAIGGVVPALSISLGGN